MYVFKVHTEQNEVGCTKHLSNAYLERASLKFTTRLYGQVILLGLPKMHLIIKDWPKSSVHPFPLPLVCILTQF